MPGVSEGEDLPNRSDEEAFDVEVPSAGAGGPPDPMAYELNIHANRRGEVTTLSTQVAEELLDNPPAPNPALMSLLAAGTMQRTMNYGESPIETAQRALDGGVARDPNQVRPGDYGRSAFESLYDRAVPASQNLGRMSAALGHSRQALHDMARRAGPGATELRFLAPGGQVEAVQLERVVAQGRYDRWYVEDTMRALGNPFSSEWGQELYSRVLAASGGNRDLLRILTPILNEALSLVNTPEGGRDQMILATCIMLLVEDRQWSEEGMNELVGYEFEMDRDIRTMEYHIVMHARRVVDNARLIMEASSPARSAASTYTESLRPSRPTEKKAPELPKAPTGRRLRLGKEVSNVAPGDIGVPTQPSSDGRESTRKVNLRKRRT
jgi:hypothetical protein